jgi:hypothetical protein
MSSVLLNFNKNLDNGDPFKFSQFFDDKVQIPENATLSLNNAQLTRKAIVVVDDSPITINLTNPPGKDIARTFDVLRNAGDLSKRVSDISFTFPKGNYSKREFLNTLYDATNDAIDEYNLDTTHSRCPYSALVANTNEKAVYGLALDYEKLPLSFHPTLNRFANNMSFQSSNIALIPESVGSVSATEYNTFGYCQSGFNTLNFDKDNIEQSSITFGLFDNDTSGTSREYNLVFSNQVLADGWTVGTEMDKATVNLSGIEVPTGFIGIQWVNDATSPTQASIVIYQSSNLATFTNEGFELNAAAELGNMVLVETFLTEEVNENQRYAFQFYQENDYNASDESKYKNYYRLLQYNTDTKAEDLFQPANSVLFDSKVYGKTISNDLMARNFKVDGDYMSGMVPVFAMKNISGSDPEDQGFYDIQAPFITKTVNELDTFLSLNNFGIGYYSLTVGDDLANIFGDDVIVKMNPNGITSESNHTADFGISQFYQDDLVYNVQVDNLPIQTFQSISKGSDTVMNIGTKKPVVLKLNSLFSGKVDNLNSSRLTRTHYENYNKNLKLRNKYRIDTNNFDVSIRRAGSNQLATEITNCSIELVFDKE